MVILNGIKTRYNGTNNLLVSTALQFDKLVYCYCFRFNRNKFTFDYKCGKMYPAVAVNRGKQVYIALTDSEFETVQHLNYYDSAMIAEVIG